MVFGSSGGGPVREMIALIVIEACFSKRYFLTRAVRAAEPC
jgi:hypothetical protein